MNILHVENTAGVGWQIAQGQRALGHHAEVLETYRGRIHFGHDHENYYEGPTIPLKMIHTLLLARHYDIVHMHAGIAFKRIDIPAIKRILHKPLVVHYHGSETRMGYGMHWQHLVDAKIVATPDLLKWHAEAEFIPNPMELMDATWQDGPLCVVHLPTSRERKGTLAIIGAVNALRSEGYHIDFNIIQGRPHTEALRDISRANIVIDQVTLTLDDHPAGLMGMVSLEGMAMGKCVINSMRADAYGRFYPEGYPCIYADESTIKDTLASLLEDPGNARRVGELGRRWVSEHLRPDIIAKRHLQIYEDVLGRR